MRTIDAEKLKQKLIEGDGHDDDRFTEGYNFAINEIKGYIDKMPTIEAEPVKHGRWKLSDDKNWLTCSSCGADVDVSCGAPFFYVDNDEVSHINFCPNCGCKQDLEGGDING